MDAVEKRVHRRWKVLGYEALLPEEQGYVAAWWLVVDVNNGGLHQYLTNNTGNSALIALDALQRAGATETHAILKEALTVLDAVGGYCVDRRTREDRIDRLPRQGAEFDALDKRFYNFGDEPLGRILTRVDEIHRDSGIDA